MVTRVAGTGSAGYADGTGTDAIFNEIRYLYLDTNSVLYVTELNNYDIRRVFVSSCSSGYYYSSSSCVIAPEGLFDLQFSSSSSFSFFDEL